MQRKRIDLTGRTFGRLKALEFIGYIDGKSWYRVQCTCGITQVNPYQDLITGKTTQCRYCQTRSRALRFSELAHQRRRQGFLPSERRVEFGPQSLIKVGGPLRREFNSWECMIKRCYYPKNKDYKNYGAKGVTVCDAWLYSFPRFLADVGARPMGKTLDRYPNPSGNYEPGNVRWASSIEQANNHRPKAKPIHKVQTTELIAA